MLAALPVIKLSDKQEENLEKVTMAIENSRECDFVFFAETTVSGFLPDDDPEKMLPLGTEIPGPITDGISRVCSRNGTWASVGLLERENGRLFDTAVVINSSGEIAMKYRRLSPGWHWPTSDPEVFCQGDRVHSVDTPFGKMACLICGDFFDEQGQLDQIAELKPDFLHLPLVRTGGEGVRYSQEEWERKDLPEYSERVKKIGIPVFMVNYIHAECYGGATVFKGDGGVLASWPLWKRGILKHDLDI